MNAQANPARFSGRLIKVLNVLGPYLGLLLVAGFFCAQPVIRPVFLSGANFKLILLQTVIVAVGALGRTLVIARGGIDLSVGSVVALSGVVAATLLATMKSIMPA